MAGIKEYLDAIDTAKKNGDEISIDFSAVPEGIDKNLLAVNLHWGLPDSYKKPILEAAKTNSVTKINFSQTPKLAEMPEFRARSRYEGGGEIRKLTLWEEFKREFIPQIRRLPGGDVRVDEGTAFKEFEKGFAGAGGVNSPEGDGGPPKTIPEWGARIGGGIAGQMLQLATLGPIVGIPIATKLKAFLGPAAILNPRAANWIINGTAASATFGMRGMLEETGRQVVNQEFDPKTIVKKGLLEAPFGLLTVLFGPSADTAKKVVQAAQAEAGAAAGKALPTLTGAAASAAAKGPGAASKILSAVAGPGGSMLGLMAGQGAAFGGYAVFRKLAENGGLSEKDIPDILTSIGVGVLLQRLKGVKYYEGIYGENFENFAVNELKAKFLAREPNLTPSEVSFKVALSLNGLRLEQRPAIYQELKGATSYEALKEILVKKGILSASQLDSVKAGMAGVRPEFLAKAKTDFPKLAGLIDKIISVSSVQLPAASKTNGAEAPTPKKEYPDLIAQSSTVKGQSKANEPEGSTPMVKGQSKANEPEGSTPIPEIEKDILNRIRDISGMLENPKLKDPYRANYMNEMDSLSKKLQELRAHRSSLIAHGEKQSAVPGQADKFFVRTEAGFDEVEGQPVKISGYEKLDFFTTKLEDGNYGIVEGRSGQLIAQTEAASPQEAVNALENQLKEKNTTPEILAEEFGGIINKEGISPRHQALKTAASGQQPAASKTNEPTPAVRNRTDAGVSLPAQKGSTP